MFTFATFRPDSMPVCLGGVPEDSGDAGVNVCRLLYSEDAKRATPPPIWGAKTPFTPIIFRTKNTAKSQPAFGWKKFRKKFAGKCFGEKESPQSCGKGARGAEI